MEERIEIRLRKEIGTGENSLGERMESKDLKRKIASD